MHIFNIYQRSLFLLMLWIGGMNLGCKKLVEVDPPKNQLVTAAVFENEATANSAVASMYRAVKDKTFLDNSATLVTGLSSDELINLVTNATLDAFSKNALQETNGGIASSWAGWYQVIYQSNAIIEGLATSNLPQASKDIFEAEALFIRSYGYWQLVNQYGDVPLLLSTNVQGNAHSKRITVTVIYDQIIKDLLRAQQQLPLVNTYALSEKIRVNKWAATALLARVYLYRQNWPAAEAQASAVIASGNYQLLVDITNIFSKNNSEAIFQLVNNATGDGNYEVGAYYLSTTPNVVASTSLMNAFENNDQRKTKWLKPVLIGTNTFYAPYKYKIAGAITTEYLTLFRYSELFLLRAEARAHQGKFNGANSAAADLNTIRARAGLLPTTAADEPTFLAAIERERQVELFAETGHRWFDLKRTGRVDPVLSAVKGSNWQPTDAVYPLPLADIQKNSALLQNPGY